MKLKKNYIIFGIIMVMNNDKNRDGITKWYIKKGIYSGLQGILNMMDI